MRSHVGKDAPHLLSEIVHELVCHIDFRASRSRKNEGTRGRIAKIVVPVASVVDTIAAHRTRASL
jgi:hypothetical protein